MCFLSLYNMYEALEIKSISKPPDTLSAAAPEHLAVLLLLYMVFFDMLSRAY